MVGKINNLKEKSQVVKRADITEEVITVPNIDDFIKIAGQCFYVENDLCFYKKGNNKWFKLIESEQLILEEIENLKRQFIGAIKQKEEEIKSLSEIIQELTELMKKLKTDFDKLSN